MAFPPLQRPVGCCSNITATARTTRSPSNATWASGASASLLMDGMRLPNVKPEKVSSVSESGQELLPPQVQKPWDWEGTVTCCRGTAKGLGVG